MRRPEVTFALLGSLLSILFLLTINLLHSPGHPWFLYASYPILWWPILIMSDKKRKSVSLAMLGSFITIIYYSMLNAALSPHYPWAIYPMYAVLWWPLAVQFGKTKRFLELSIWASLLTIIFFIVVNMVSSPFTIWAVYPIFVILWWPLCMYFYKYKKDYEPRKIKMR